MSANKPRVFVQRREIPVDMLPGRQEVVWRTAESVYGSESFLFHVEIEDEPRPLNATPGLRLH